MARRADIRELRAAYDAQQAALAGWIAALPADAWAGPSALPGWAVRDLAMHTTEVPGSLTRALANGPVDDRALTIAEYTSAWVMKAPEIAERARGAAVGLTVADVVEQHAREHAALSDALDALEGDPVVRARRGPIAVSDFLMTRVNELVVHSLDLSASVPDVDRVPVDRSALGVAVRMLLDVLRERAPGRSVEVRVPPYAAAQVVEGPRHTRGTPGSVVECDPETWVRVACGRMSWADGVRAGGISASGERADLSAYLPVLS